MKFVALKNAFMTVSFLFAVGHTDITPAHSVTGALGVEAHATDLYQVTCFTEPGGPATDRIAAHVQDNLPVEALLVSVQTLKGFVATNSTDSIDGDAGYSPLVANNGGNGVYQVLVDKSAEGSKIYTLEFHCETSTGVHTGTQIVQLQNQ